MQPAEVQDFANYAKNTQAKIGGLTMVERNKKPPKRHLSSIGGMKYPKQSPIAFADPFAMPQEPDYYSMSPLDPEVWKNRLLCDFDYDEDEDW